MHFVVIKLCSKLLLFSHYCRLGDTCCKITLATPKVGIYLISGIFGEVGILSSVRFKASTTTSPDWLKADDTDVTRLGRWLTQMSATRQPEQRHDLKLT